MRPSRRPLGRPRRPGRPADPRSPTPSATWRTGWPRAGPRGVESGTGQQMGPLFFDPQGADFTAWINHFKNEVYRNWIVPPSVALGARGHVDLEFRVERDGRVFGAAAHRVVGHPRPRSRGAQRAPGQPFPAPAERLPPRPGRDAGLVLLQRGGRLVTRPPRWRDGRSPAASLAATIAATMALAASCRTVPRTAPVHPDARPPQATTSTGVPSGTQGIVPVVRVGILIDVPRASISADDGIVVREADGRERRVQRATFVAVSTSAARSRFRVQIASVTDESAARDIADRARQAGVEPTLRWNAETRTHQLRVGDLADPRGGAGPGRAAGRGGDGRGLGGRRNRRLAAGPAPPAGDRRRDDAGHADHHGPPGETLAADGLTYRGYLEVRAGEAGLTVINVLDIEDYLRGVVPNELSPNAFPALEGLKAQAVAARTYVLRNRGQFAGRGYDICATPTCQVYGGRSTEHAALRSRGGGDPRDRRLPSGQPDQRALHLDLRRAHRDRRQHLRGRAHARTSSACPAAPSARPGPRSTPPRGRRRWETRPASTGTSRCWSPSASWSRGCTPRPPSAAPATEDELRDWTSRLVTVLGRQSCAPPGRPGAGPAGTLLRPPGRVVVLGGSRHAAAVPGDEDYLLRIEDRDELRDEAERRAAAVLLQEGVVTLFPDNTLPPGRADRAHPRPDGPGPGRAGRGPAVADHRRLPSRGAGRAGRRPGGGGDDLHARPLLPGSSAR